MRYVTPAMYARLLNAIDYYTRAGYKYIDVPWAVSREAVFMTRPSWVQGEALHYEAGGQDLYPVASAEQSFLQMRLDNPSITGKYVTMTPCFRNELVIDDQHQPYFMKLELINWEHTGREDLDKMIADARFFFETDVWVSAVPNTDPDPLGVVAYDLVSLHERIELGSYGIRTHPKVGRWLYGTGLAEPRYSYAIEVEDALEASKGTQTS
jgi:hypothetical protein